MSTIRSARALWRDRPLRRALFLAGLFLVAAGLVAIGVSGTLALGAQAALGDRFVAGDLPDTTYTSARCAEFREYAPHARTCAQTAATHHTTEVVDYRLAAGALGVTLLAGWHIARRRNPGADLPALLVPTIGAAVFGAAAAALGVPALNALTLDAAHAGAGQWLTGAVVAAAIATWFACRVLRGLVSARLSPHPQCVG
jgi:hypothetical protein